MYFYIVTFFVIVFLAVSVRLYLKKENKKRDERNRKLRESVERENRRALYWNHVFEFKFPNNSTCHNDMYYTYKKQNKNCCKIDTITKH